MSIIEFPSILKAVDNLGTVMSNLLKTQAKMDVLKDKLANLDTDESEQLLEQYGQAYERKS